MEDVLKDVIIEEKEQEGRIFNLYVDKTEIAEKIYEKIIIAFISVFIMTFSGQSMFVPETGIFFAVRSGLRDFPISQSKPESSPLTGDVRFPLTPKTGSRPERNTGRGPSKCSSPNSSGFSQSRPLRTGAQVMARSGFPFTSFRIFPKQ